MKTLSRLVILVLSIALVAATYMAHMNMTHIAIGHDNYYTMKSPWLSDIREISLYGVLIWCILFAKSETTFVRIGLIAVVLAFILMAFPAKEGLDQLPQEIRSALHR